VGRRIPGAGQRTAISPSPTAPAVCLASATARIDLHSGACVMDSKVNTRRRRAIPRPAFLGETVEGKLLIKRCTACGEPHYFPARSARSASPTRRYGRKARARRDLQLQPDAQVRVGALPIGYVTLKEGPSLLTNFVDCDMDKLKIGQKVKVVFKDHRWRAAAVLYAGLKYLLPLWEKVPSRSEGG